MISCLKSGRPLSSRECTGTEKSQIWDHRGKKIREKVETEIDKWIEEWKLRREAGCQKAQDCLFQPVFLKSS